MAIKEILKLGDQRLYDLSTELTYDQIARAREIVTDLHDTMKHFRKCHGFGRAIAAPQIDQFFRVIYVDFANTQLAIINPKLQPIGEETIELWDDCMSFPGWEVKLTRYAKCYLSYKDLDWNDCQLELTGDLSELVQHEFDHLNGILAVHRALDSHSFRLVRVPCAGGKL